MDEGADAVRDIDRSVTVPVEETDVSGIDRRAVSARKHGRFAEEQMPQDPNRVCDIHEAVLIAIERLLPPALAIATVVVAEAAQLRAIFRDAGDDDRAGVRR